MKALKDVGPAGTVVGALVTLMANDRVGYHQYPGIIIIHSCTRARMCGLLLWIRLPASEGSVTVFCCCRNNQISQGLL
jgi:hypothetical protein